MLSGKKFHSPFIKFRYMLDIQTNLKFTYYLDVTLNFSKSSQCCIDIGCNHAKQVFKHIPDGVMFSFSTVSSNFNIFNQSKSNYEIVVNTIEAIKKNSSVETRIKLLMQIIGGKQGQKNLIILCHHTIQLQALNYGRYSLGY